MKPPGDLPRDGVPSKGSDPTSTEIVHATELWERVINRIAEIRNPELFKSYTAELRRYKRRLGKRKEITKEERLPLLSTKRRGFTKRVYDNATIFVPRPERPLPRGYGYSSYSREGGFTTHAGVFGLLATPRYNRDIRPQRVAEYHEEMQAGRWRDLAHGPYLDYGRRAGAQWSTSPCRSGGCGLGGGG